VPIRLMDGELPDKPKRMRWTTYNRLIGELVAADRVAEGISPGTLSGRAIQKNKTCRAR